MDQDHLLRPTQPPFFPGLLVAQIDELFAIDAQPRKQAIGQQDRQLPSTRRIFLEFWIIFFEIPKMVSNLTVLSSLLNILLRA